jgi:hypothetical protein
MVLPGTYRAQRDVTGYLAFDRLVRTIDGENVGGRGRRPGGHDHQLPGGEQDHALAGHVEGRRSARAGRACSILKSRIRTVGSSLVSLLPLADAVMVNRPMSLAIDFTGLPCWSTKTVILPVPFSTWVIAKLQSRRSRRSCRHGLLGVIGRSLVSERRRILRAGVRRR